MKIFETIDAEIKKHQLNVNPNAAFSIEEDSENEIKCYCYPDEDVSGSQNAYCFIFDLISGDLKATTKRTYNGSSVVYK